ncbi:MAG: serine/threonine protein kinase [Chloroflexota bacterium]
MANTPSWIGKKLSDRYEIEELLGQGGMASVYKALDPNLRRTVAIKLIHSHLSKDPEFVSRFEEEAAAVAQIRHSNIIQVYDFDNDGDDYYMVLEYILGETLQERLNRLAKNNRFMSLEDAIMTITSICDALQYTHTRGMIHRDIKPANIMSTVEGQTILMDFGVAKIVGGKEHTATGAVVGTARYMSPEIIKGEKPDFSVDIYSTGVTLFESLSGKPPFVADSVMSTLMMHINDPVPDLREINDKVPESLVLVIGKALEKDKNDRYTSAAEFAEALRAIETSINIQEIAVSIDPIPSKAMTEPHTSLPSPRASIIEEPTGHSTQDINNGGSATVSAPSSEITHLEASHPPDTGNAKRDLFTGRSLITIIAGGLLLLSAVSFFWNRALTSNLEDTTADGAAALVIPTETDTSGMEFLPSVSPDLVLIPTATAPPEPYVLIMNISINGSNYIVEYVTYGYTEILPGQHIHFFFNNIPPDQAGVGGSGPWYVWGGPRPFDKYTLGERPAGATQICAMVANPNHTVIMDTGNCFDLPG